jgi:hypothetical protein
LLKGDHESEGSWIVAKKTLVVDDSAVIRQVEHAVLAKAGCDVVSASGGREGVATMESDSFHLRCPGVVGLGEAPRSLPACHST